MGAMAHAASVTIAEAMETIAQSMTNGRSALLSLLTDIIRLVLIDSSGW
jgi:hypothetical protein